MRKLVGLFTAAFMVAVALVALPVTQAPKVEAAPPGSAFDPGLIISDSVFFDFGSMTLKQVQDFLNSRVADCNQSQETKIRKKKQEMMTIPKMQTRQKKKKKKKQKKKKQKKKKKKKKQKKMMMMMKKPE